jgi:hypothetical protein
MAIDIRNSSDWSFESQPIDIDYHTSRFEAFYIFFLDDSFPEMKLL